MASSAGAVRAGGAYVEIFAKDGQFQQAMTRVQNRLKAAAQTMRQIGTTLSIGGAALGAPFVVAAREAANFTLAMAQVRVNTGATEDQFKRLTDAARQMGVAMGRSPTETAQAMSDLAKAGLDAEGTIKAIGPVLALAAADNMELARTVEVVVGTMSQFGMSTKDFGSIADRLQAAANASVTSVDKIGESLSYVGPIASDTGQSFDDVAAAIGTLAQAGLPASMAGTQLAHVLQQMVEEEGKINNLGVSVRDLNGNLRPFMDILADINTKTAGLTNTDRVATFMDIFDARGSRAAISLSKLGGEFDRILGTIQGSAGAASGKASQVLQSFGGQVNILAAKFADLKIAVITSMGATATAVVAGLGKALEVVTKFAEKNPTLVATIAAVAGGMLALGVAAITASIGLQVIAAGIGVLRTGLSILPALFSPVGLAATAAFAAVAAGVVIARTLSPAFKRETDGIMAALMQLDFVSAWKIMSINYAIYLTQMAAKTSSILGTIQGFFAATGAFIGDKLIEGIDRFMGLFGADIITLQNAWELLGIYFRAAFDWQFAATGMKAAIKEADAAAERARARSPTADARAEDRKSARQAAADARQAEMDATAQGFADTIDTLREDLDRVHEGLKPKPAETPEVAVGAVPGRPDLGVMPVGAGAAAETAARSGIGQTLGTFGTGAGLGIGPELNDATQQTAANTASSAESLKQIAASVAQPPQTAGSVSGAVAAPRAAAVANAAASGAATAAETMTLSQTMSTGFGAMVNAIKEHAKLTAHGNAALDAIAKGIDGIGGAFA